MTTAARPEDALARLFHEHHRELVRLAVLLLDDPGQAEEVVQEAYVRLHRSLPRLADHGAAPAYLRSIVLNLARSGLRRRGVARRHAEVVGRAPTAEVSSAETAALARHERSRLADRVRALPRRQRECIVLRYFAGQTDVEIAADLELSPSSVNTHVQRGLAALAAGMEGER